MDDVELYVKGEVNVEVPNIFGGLKKVSS